MVQLTKQQIVRQDFVDNQIFALVNSLLPSQKQVEWDIEMIGDIRDVVRKRLVNKLDIVEETTFYPYIQKVRSRKKLHSNHGGK